MPIDIPGNRRSLGCAEARHRAIALVALALVCPPTLAQVQFVDQTASRFPQPFPQEYSNQVAIYDLDGDGDLDVVFANGGGYNSPTAPQAIRVYINNGSGVFADETAPRTGGATAIARDVEFGDIDGDGDADMVVATDFATQPRVLVNIGAGVFADQTGARLPALPLGSAHVALADVDADGDLDLVFANGGPSRFGTGPTKLLINNGAGVFADESAARLPAINIAQPMDVILGDVDNDLDLDILVGSRAASGSVLFTNNGHGVFARGPALPATSMCYSFDFADFDRDGDLDVFGVNTLPGGVKESIWTNTGAPAWSFTDVTATALPGANNPGIDDNDSKFLDSDADGDLDVVIASLGSSERLCRNNGNGTFTLLAGAITAVADSSLDIEVGDLDGDGDLDMVTAQGESGSFVNRVYINVSGPADTTPPRIDLEESLANSRDTSGPYAVRAEVSDDMTSDHGFFAQSIRLSYTVDAGAPALVDVRWSGHQLYRALIPGQPCGSTIHYHVVATDKAGNIGTGPDRSFQVVPYADCDLSGSRDINDFICFQTRYALGDPYADCDGNGTRNINDLICFQTRFAIGCP